MGKNRHNHKKTAAKPGKFGANNKVPRADGVQKGPQKAFFGDFCTADGLFYLLVNANLVGLAKMPYLKTLVLHGLFVRTYPDIPISHKVLQKDDCIPQGTLKFGPQIWVGDLMSTLYMGGNFQNNPFWYQKATFFEKNVFFLIKNLKTNHNILTSLKFPAIVALIKRCYVIVDYFLLSILGGLVSYEENVNCSFDPCGSRGSICTGTYLERDRRNRCPGPYSRRRG
jgi:hypothetical protein